jgi:hypothetical protein
VASSGQRRPYAESSLPFWKFIWPRHTSTLRSDLGWYRPATRPCPMSDVATVWGGIVIVDRRCKIDTKF